MTFYGVWKTRKVANVLQRTICLAALLLGTHLLDAVAFILILFLQGWSKVYLVKQLRVDVRFFFGAYAMNHKDVLETLVFRKQHSGLVQKHVVAKLALRLSSLTNKLHLVG